MLAVNFFSVFREYMGILLFICLPLIVLSAALAIWLHYRQKKRREADANIPDQLSDFHLSSNNEATLLVAESPLAQEDQISLIRECRKQLTKSRAKFVALKHDVNAIQTLSSTSTSLTENNNSHMESIHEKIAAYEKQIADLQSKLEVMETVFPVQDEAHFLRQAIRERDNEIDSLKAAIAGSDKNEETEKAAPQVNDTIVAVVPELNHLQEQIKQLERDNAALRARIKEQDYVKDIYSETKIQVEFLQNQLEHRIRTSNEIEHKNKELSADLHRAITRSQELDGKTIFLNQQYESKQHETEQLQHTIDQKEAELHRTTEELRNKNAQIAHLENLLAEIREQHSILNISYADSQGAISVLKEQLAGEQQHIHQVEDKLLRNRQLLERIYKDLESSVINGDAGKIEPALVKQMF